MVDIMFPLKGWDTNHPRNQQPENTSADLLNVVPFDRDYRGRGAVRPGLSKFISTQLGNGAQPVLLVGEVTRALDPTTIQPSTQLLNYDFTTIAAGTHMNVYPASGPPYDWRVTGGYNHGNGNANTGDKLVIGTVGGVTTCQGVESSWDNGQLNAAFALGPAYIIKAQFAMTATGNTANQGVGYRIMFRVDPTWAHALSLEMTRDRIAFFSDIGSSNSGGSETSFFHFPATLSSGVHVMELHVNGDVMSAWVDGIQYLSQTSSSLNTNSGVGFGIASSFGSDGLQKFQLYTGQPLAAFRETDVVAVCGGNIYVGNSSSLAVATAGTGVLSVVTKPQMAYSKGICYFTDSQHNLLALNLQSQTVANATISTGSETATTLGAYSVTCTWRDRLVLAASAATPQNFIMSRQGDQTDFDYSQTDAAAAVAGNASKAGAIGDPLNCLIPWTDDILILGGDHSIYKVEGDIAAGGQILLISDSVGTLGPDCWDADPAGNVYFVGSGGLYQMSPSGQPVNLANESVKAIFANIDRVNTYVVLTWDRDRNGLHIHLTPVNSGTATHIFYDATAQGFFPIQYPNTIGPITAVVFDGDGPLDRQLLLAGRDGYIRKVDPTSLTDDGTAITSYVQMGPLRPAGDAALSVLEGLEIILGDAPTGFTESDFQVGLAIETGKDAYTALTSPERTVSFSFTKQSRRKRLLQRISGGTFYFKVSGVSGKLWSMEKLVALFTEGGLQRRY